MSLHQSTTRVLARANGVLVLGLLGLVAWQQHSITTLNRSLRAKEYLVVPGAADFVPIRANTIPDASLIGFVEYFVPQMVSVTHTNLVRRAEALEHLMSPSLVAYLDQELSSKAVVLRNISGAEVFEQLEPPHIVRKTDQTGRSYFEATLRGRVHRYAGERRLQSTVEVVTVLFRSRSTLGADEPWMFEVTDFQRRAESEHQAHERAQKMARGAK